MLTCWAGAFIQPLCMQVPAAHGCRQLGGSAGYGGLCPGCQLWRPALCKRRRGHNGVGGNAGISCPQDQPRALQASARRSAPREPGVGLHSRPGEACGCVALRQHRIFVVFEFCVFSAPCGIQWLTCCHLSRSSHSLADMPRMTMPVREYCNQRLQHALLHSGVSARHIL